MSFARAVQALRLSCHRFDAVGHEAKRLALQRLARTALQDTRALLRYHELLLFLRAHPSNAALLAQIEGELGRIARFLGQRRRRRSPHLENSGLPFTNTVTRFTHDCVRWLLGHAHCRVAPDSYGEPQLDLNAVLA